MQTDPNHSSVAADAQKALRDLAVWACQDICFKRGTMIIDNAAVSLRMGSIATTRGLDLADLRAKAGFPKHRHFVAHHTDLFEEQDKESGGHVRFLGITTLDPTTTAEFIAAKAIVTEFVHNNNESISISQVGLRLREGMRDKGFPEPAIPPGFRDLSEFLIRAGLPPVDGRVHPTSGADVAAASGATQATQGSTMITMTRGSGPPTPPTSGLQPGSPARTMIRNTDTAHENAAPKHDSTQGTPKTQPFTQALASFLAERGATVEQARLLAPLQANVTDAVAVAVKELNLGSATDARIATIPGGDAATRKANIEKLVSAWSRMGRRLAVICDAASVDRKLATIIGRKPTYPDRPRWTDAPKRLVAKFGTPVQCFYSLRHDRIPESEQWVNELRSAGWTVLPAKYRRGPDDTFRDDDDLAIGDLLDKFIGKPEYDILLLTHDARENSAGGSNAERLRKLAGDSTRKVMVGAYDGYLPSGFNRLRETGAITIHDIDRDLGLHDMPVPRQPAPEPVSETTDFDQLIGNAPIIGAG